MAQALPRPLSLDAAPPPAPEDTAVRELPLAFRARDGYQLSGMLYLPVDDNLRDDVVVFNPGGGVACRRYRHFLRYLASEGLPVLAYDYRGVGASAPSRRRGFDAGIEDWSELDQASAIELAAARFPGARLATVSHSIGCMIAAAAPNADRLAQMVFIAPHTGYWGDYRPPWRWPMTFVWHAFMPLVAQIVGYFPASWFGLGDDFPRRFALQWAGRTSQGRVSEALIAAQVQDRLLQSVRNVRVPALVVSSELDAFVTEMACMRFLTFLHRVRPIRVHFNRHELRTTTFAHFDYFRRINAAVWARIAAFLQAPIPH